MGLTIVKVELANPADRSHWEPLEFLVDSGAIHSVVPSATLASLGITPYGEQEYRLANGDAITRQKGMGMFRMGDKVGCSDVIFGEPGDSNLLGALTLESLGVVLDPLKRELRPLPMILGGWQAPHPS